MPLNDTLAGDESKGGRTSGLIVSGSEDEKEEMSLYNCKLVGIVTGKLDGDASMINSSGEVVQVQLNEESSEGVSVVLLGKNDVV